MRRWCSLDLCHIPAGGRREPPPCRGWGRCRLVGWSWWLQAGFYVLGSVVIVDALLMIDMMAIVVTDRPFSSISTVFSLQTKQPGRQGGLRYNHILMPGNAQISNHRTTSAFSKGKKTVLRCGSVLLGKTLVSWRNSISRLRQISRRPHFLFQSVPISKPRP